MRIRVARPDADAAAVADIYRRAIEGSVASFESEPPDAAAMAERIAGTLPAHPWLVAEEDGAVVGYAYAGPHRSRAAYRWSVDVSAYVAAGQQGRGVGRALYDELLRVLRAQGFVQAYAGIALPNVASERLHAAVGMRRFAVYEAVGWKFGAWRDVAWYAMRLVDPLPDRPAEPVPFGRLTPQG